MLSNEELETRIKRLEYRVKELVGLVDDEKDAFSHFILSEELKEEDSDAIFDLMNKTRSEIDAGSPPSFTEFEDRVYRIIPSRRNDYHFVARLVRSLKRYEDVYNHLKSQGMNNL